MPASKSTPLSVCVLGYGLHPPWDEGTRVLTRDMISALITETEYNISVVSTKRRGSQTTTTFEVEYVGESSVGTLAESLGFYRYNTDIPMMVKLALKLYTRSVWGDIDVIHAGFASHSLFSLVSEIPPRTKFVAHMFGGLEHKGLLKRLGTVKRVDAYVTSSNSDIAELEQFGVPASKIWYLPPVVTNQMRDKQTARDELGMNQESFVVGYLGNVNDRRFPQSFASALNTFAESTEVEAYVFTKKIEDEDIREFENLNVFVTSLSQEQKEQALSAVDTWVFPFDFEDTNEAPVIDPPLTVLEAMAASRPVVASRSLSLPSVITDGESGYLVEPGDSNAIISTLESIRSGPTIAEQVGMNARKVIDERHNPRAVATVLEEIYTEVCSHD